MKNHFAISMLFTMRLFCFCAVLVLSGLTGWNCTAAQGDASSQSGAVDASKPENNRQQTWVVLGTVKDELNRLLEGVALIIVRVHPAEQSIKVSETTSENGWFRMQVPRLTDDELDQGFSYSLVAKSSGFASVIEPRVQGQRELTLRLPRAVQLQGSVVDSNGEPVADAIVCDSRVRGWQVAGVLKTKSQADGTFSIDDFSPLDRLAVNQFNNRQRAFETLSRLLVQHPNFAERLYVVPGTAGELKIELSPYGRIEGQVVDGVTGKPASNVTVTAQPTKQSSLNVADCQIWQSVKTDLNGRFEFPKLATLEFNVWASAPDRTCAALNSLAVIANETTKADLHLIEGGWLEGRVVTLKGSPVTHDSFDSGKRLHVGVSGPARPRSGTRFETCEVDDEGRFRLRVPRGKNFPRLLSESEWSRVWRRDRIEQGIAVKAGETVSVKFRVLDRPAIVGPPRPGRDSVILPPPVDDERDAAETIRDLGGWYTLDADQHVTEINMVYHNGGGVRYDNAYVNTDEAMRLAGAFPRLTGLYLKKGQATDESMICLQDLEELEAFFVWDAEALTDAGTVHLIHLKNLTRIHLSQSKISDGTLEVLSKLPNLTRMSLQGNQFTDVGLSHLANARRVQSLWLGMSKGKITDAALEYLSQIEGLQELDLSNTELTDAGLESLRDFKNLTRLYTSGTKVTQEGLDNIGKEMPNLKFIR